MLLWWYIRNLHADGEGISGLLGLKEEEDISGEELRVRTLARKERELTRDVESVRRRAAAAKAKQADRQEDPGKEDQQSVKPVPDDKAVTQNTDNAERPYRRIER